MSRWLGYLFFNKSAQLTACVISPTSARYLGTARFFAALALPLIIISCAGPQSIELSVDRAVLTDSIAGKPAMDVYLNSKSAREFAMFTAKLLSRSVEVKFRKMLITRVVLLTPVEGGIFQVSVLSGPVDGTLNEGNAAEVAQKLSSGDAKLEVRLAD
jgi:hypothetical protein